MNAVAGTNDTCDIGVIIVEDSFVVAESLESLLTSHGCRVVGKAADVQGGLLLVTNTDYDVAVLDVRLGHELVTDVARAAQGRGKRIVYLTGYSDLSLIPPDLSGHPVLPKPVHAEALLDAIRGK